MNIDARQIFWIDAGGAVLSILLLLVILPAIQPYMGMPIHVLYTLSLCPILCLLYDGYCLRFADLRNPIWLIGIMTMNTLYCVLSLILLVQHYSELTPFGIFYFISEQRVILGLVYWSLESINSLCEHLKKRFFCKKSPRKMSNREVVRSLR